MAYVFPWSPGGGEVSTVPPNRTENTQVMNMFNTLFNGRCQRAVCALMLAGSRARLGPTSDQERMSQLSSAFRASSEPTGRRPTAASAGSGLSAEFLSARASWWAATVNAFFFQTDDPKLGIFATLATGFILQDAFMEYKVILTCRSPAEIDPVFAPGLQSTLSFYSADISAVSVNNAALQQSALHGMGLRRGYSSGSPSIPRRPLAGERD